MRLLIPGLPLILGLLYAADAAPSFNLTESQALQNVFNGVKEGSATIFAGSLSCQDSASRTKIVKVEDGDSFITITPVGLAFTNVYIKPLDYELTKTDLSQQNNKKITIVCENVNGEVTRFEGTLVILDINDNIPIFERTDVSYQVEINEILNGTIPQIIYPPPNIPNFTNKIIVTDADGVDNNIVKPVCVGLDNGMPCTGLFDVLLQPISNGRYQFNITALRNNYTGFGDITLEIKAVNVPLDVTQKTLESITQNVVIKIKDIQNLPPNIDKDTLTFDMYEDLAPGNELGSGGVPKYIAAFDQDVGDPNAIRFELAPTLSDPFAFNKNFFKLGTTFLDGKVYKVPLVLQNYVDREAIEGASKTLSIDIKAIEYDPLNRTNRNPMQARETLIISIGDRNDQVPKFNAPVYNIQVTELPVISNPELFRQISNNLEIKVTDTDSTLFNSFTVSIVQGNENNNFKLDKMNGSAEEVFVIYAREKILDYELPTKQYTLKLRAVDRDMTSFTSEATVNIQVLDANDQSPKFPTDVVTFSVKENEPNGTLIGTITATDGDSGDFGRIVLYEIRDLSDTFRIDNQGRIYLKKLLDYEIRSTYFFTGIAYDGGRRDGTVLINVLVQNVNDVGPEFASSYIAQLFEETKVLIPEIRVKATSREAGNQTVEYFIDAIRPLTVPQNAFSIDRVTGVVTVNQFVDYKQTDRNNPGSVFVTIRAQTGTLNSTTIASITIIDVNNFPPVFVPQVANNIYYAQISELANAGNIVIDLNVTDGDDPATLNGQVEFQIQSGANDDFQILGDSGVIIVTSNAKLDIDLRQSKYEITVLARDKGSPRKEATATVMVTLVDANNKNPEFLNALYRFQINEDDPVSTQIGKVTATDLDKDHILTYSIDFTKVEFQRKGNTIQENIDARNIIKMVDNKADSSGIIQVAGRIDRNTYDRINFNVIVEDVDPNIRGKQTGTASVVVFILAAVDPRIYFDLPWTRENPVITLTYTESKNINYQIMTLKATDPSIPETVETYHKKPASDPQDYFDIQGRFVYIKKVLDYEALTGTYQRNVSVVVEAISRDSLKTGTATIVVIVQDLNDNAPEFEKSSYTFLVPEDKTFTYPVGRVKATDKDSSSYGQVEYYIMGSNSNDFSIYTERSGSENEAVIIVSETAKLDFETTPVYNLVLVARDNPGGTNTVKFSTSVPIEIIIEDRNDMSPVFQELEYRFSIIGTQAVGGDVGFILAEDGDAGVNGEVDYSILSATNDGAVYFNIETVDQTSARFGEVLKIGRIFVQRSLENLPDRSLFELTVVARDRGNPPTAPGQCKVYITVSKGVQDLKPKWDERLPVRVKIPENQNPGYPVVKVTAYPANATSSIVYKFLGAGDALKDYESFNIDPNTGQITTAVKLDYEQKRIYNLLILATDSMNATLFNQFLLIVEVTDVDDNDPSFTACPGKKYQIPEVVYVNEEIPPAVFVYRVEACDIDSPPNNQVRYTWFTDNSYCDPANLNVFTLNDTTGDIYTKVKLDRETKSEYLLCIQANKVVIPSGRKKRDMTSDLKARTNHNTTLYLRVLVNDVNDNGPKFYNAVVKKVIQQYPSATLDISVAEAYDIDLAPNNGIRYSIESIKFIIHGKVQNAPTAFSINSNDGTIAIGTNDYTDYLGGYFDITVLAEDANGANVPYDEQLQKIYVTDRASRIRVIFDEPADSGVDKKAKEMITKLNDLYKAEGTYYEIETISYHVVSSDQDLSYSKTDVCIVMVQDDSVLTSANAAKQLTDVKAVRDILNSYGAVDPGPCDPAASVYPLGWESYWWVLVAFAIFIFVCCLILIFMICVLFRQYRQYMDSRKTYLVPGN